MSLMSSQDSQQGLQQQMPQASRPAASLPEGTDQEMRLQFGNFSLNGLGGDFGSAFGTAFGSSAGQESAQAQSSSAAAQAETSLLPNPQVGYLVDFGFQGSANACPPAESRWGT